MTYVALEEAFDIPELVERQAGLRSYGKLRIKTELAQEWERRLMDFDSDRLADMDAHGIDIQVLSLTVPGIQADTTAEAAVDDARFANDFLAEKISAHPDRFRGFAALPMQDPAAAAGELRRCVTQLGFCGALINDHTQGRYLDEPDFHVVWDALDELAVPLYLHPGMSALDEWRVLQGHPELYGPTWSWQAETGGHAMRLIYAGVFDRHPGATLILGHLGEFLPFQKSRMDSRYATLQLDVPLRRMPSEYIGTNILLTTSGSLAPEEIEAAVLTAGADTVMFSIDYPYENTADAVAALERSSLSDEQKRAVASGNARRVLKI